MVKLYRLAAVIFCCAALLIPNTFVSAEDIALTGAPIRESYNYIQDVPYNSSTTFSADGISFGFRSNLPSLSDTADYVLQATVTVVDFRGSTNYENPFTADINYLDFTPSSISSKRSSSGNGMGVASVNTYVSSSETVYTVSFSGSDVLSLEDSISYLYLLSGYNRQGKNYSVELVSFDVYAMESDSGPLDYISANLDELISLQIETNSKLDQLVDGVYLLQSTGMEYVDDIPDGDELADAESQLSAAEEDIENTAQNFRDMAAEGLAQASDGLTHTIAYVRTPIAYIGAILASALDVLPSELFFAFFGVPIVGFGAWLIGLVK